LIKSNMIGIESQCAGGRALLQMARRAGEAVRPRPVRWIIFLRWYPNRGRRAAVHYKNRRRQIDVIAA